MIRALAIAGLTVGSSVTVLGLIDLFDSKLGRGLFLIGLGIVVLIQVPRVWALAHARQNAEQTSEVRNDDALQDLKDWWRNPPPASLSYAVAGRFASMAAIGVALLVYYIVTDRFGWQIIALTIGSSILGIVSLRSYSYLRRRDR